MLIENNLCHQNITHTLCKYLSSKYYSYFWLLKKFTFNYYSYLLLIENNLCHQNITHTFCESKTINVIKILLIIYVNRKQFMSSKYYSYYLLIVNRKQYYTYVIYVVKILLILFVNRHQNITHTICRTKTIYVIKILRILFVNRKKMMSSKYYSYFLLIENNLCHQNITHTFC